MPDCRIEDFALISDCETAALVGRDGAIDWLCWPRFDSGACFAALLGTRDHGSWRIKPVADARVTRRYVGRTLILETRFETDDGTVTLVDFMPPRGKASDIVRMVRCERGQVAMRCELTLRFDYGKVIPWVTRLDDGTLRAIAGPDMVLLRASVETHGEGMATVADFTLAAGDSATFVLTYGPSHEPQPAPIDADRALCDTEAFWTEWSGRYRFESMDGGVSLPPVWEEAVRRSLLTLKALTYLPTGGIVAAATTSLPEKMGGERNWDYRYCWLRDSSLALFGLLNSGYFEEAQAWRDWLVRAIAGSAEQLQIMFGLAGERRLDEWTVDWLPGFAGSRPVRVGNEASTQLQLDVYGEVMSLLHLARTGGLPESKPAWALQKGMLAHLDGMWRNPDEGIWETRGGRKHFTFSKVMAWVAFDRAIASAEEFGFDGADVEAWRTTRDAIHQDVCRNGFNAEHNTFTQVYGGSEVDATLLLLAQMRFLPADDPRFVGTVQAVERDLLVNGLVMRYRTGDGGDGLPPGEGAFIACSFWLVSAYALLGRVKDASALFERLLGLSNDLGLLSEEYDPVERRQLGNFPQVFSHVALIGAAHRLAQEMGKAGSSLEQRPPARQPTVAAA